MAREYTRDRVDKEVGELLSYGKQAGVDEQGGPPDLIGQGREGNGSVICEDTWSEFILIAEYLYHNDSEAEIADVFEFFRMKDMGGTDYSPAMLKRVTREVTTECGPWDAKPN